MENIGGLLKAIWSWLDTLGPLANLLGFLGTGGAVYAWMRRSQQLEKQKAEGLLTALTAAEQQRGVLERQLAEATALDPHHWNAEAAAARQRGDEMAGLRIQMEGFAAVRVPLGQACLDIARGLEARYPAQGPAVLVEADRMARFAHLANPDSDAAAETRQLVELLVAVEDIRAGNYDEVVASTALIHAETIEPKLARHFAARLLALSLELVHARHFDLYLLVTQKARRIARAGLGEHDDLTLNARHLYAEALVVNKRYGDAREEIDQILPVMQRTMATDDARLTECQQWDALVALALGERDNLGKALAEAQKLGLLQEYDATGVIATADQATGLAIADRAIALLLAQREPALETEPR